MKKNILSFASMIAMCFIGSCTYLDQPNSVEEDIIEKKESYVISPEEALSNLETLLSDMFPATKLGLSDYNVDELSVYGGVATKSGSAQLPDTTVYILNFADSAGFAVMAAQSCMTTPVMCVTESGSLTVSDLEEAFQIIEDDSLNISVGEDFVPVLLATSILNQMSNPVPDTGGGGEGDGNGGNGDGNIPTIDQPVGGGGDPFAPSTFSYRVKKKIGPLLETKWTQSSPFNDFRSDEAPAGCVAIAVGQILAYNEYGSAGGRSFDWDLLKTVNHYSSYNPVTGEYSHGSQAAQEAVSDFIEFVGNHDNCRIRYNQNGSWAVADGAKRTFNNFQYKSVEKYLGFGDEEVEQVTAMINKRLPVFIVAVRGLESAHAWVVDGLMTRQKIHDQTGIITLTENFYHINWGWEGDSDGYFDQGVFDTSKRREIEQPLDPGTSVMIESYGWLFRTVTYSL